MTKTSPSRNCIWPSGRFHNRVVDALAGEGTPASDLFAKARRVVVRHYQWMIRHDFLPRILDKASGGLIVSDPHEIRTGRERTDDPGVAILAVVVIFRNGCSGRRAT